MEQTDEHFSALFRGFQIAQLSIESKDCGHKLERMCTKHECNESSLHYQDKNCEISYLKHQICKSTTLKGITDLLKQHFTANKEFLGNLFEVEDALIHDIIKRREDIIKKMSCGNLQKKYQKIIDEIYRKGNGEYLKGRQADEFFQKLILLSKVNKMNTDIYLQKYAAAAKKALKQLATAKQASLHQYSSSIKAVAMPIQKVKEVKEIALPVYQFKSTILKKKGQEYQENLAQLLSRASDVQKHPIKKQQVVQQRQVKLRWYKFQKDLFPKKSSFNNWMKANGFNAEDYRNIQKMENSKSFAKVEMKENVFIVVNGQLHGERPVQFIPL